MVAIVTGATGGIGTAISVALARDGYDVVLVGRKVPVLRDTAELLRKKYTRQHFYWACVHLQSPREIKKLFIRKDIPLAQLSVLVNNAGVSQGDDIFTESESDWNVGLSVNLTAPFLLSQLAVRLMKKNDTKGNIVNIASLAGLVGAKKPNYAASKAGLIGLTKATAREVGQFGIRVNAIAPGIVDTDLIADWDEKKRKAVISQTPLKKIASAEEIAEIVSFLVSPKASFLTGTVINASGGQFLG